MQSAQIKQYLEATFGKGQVRLESNGATGCKTRIAVGKADVLCITYVGPTPPRGYHEMCVPPELVKILDRVNKQKKREFHEINIRVGSIEAALGRDPYLFFSFKREEGGRATSHTLCFQVCRHSSTGPTLHALVNARIPYVPARDLDLGYKGELSLNP